MLITESLRLRRTMIEFAFLFSPFRILSFIPSPPFSRTRSQPAYPMGQRPFVSVGRRCLAGMRGRLGRVVTEERSREVRSVVDLVAGWAAERGDVRGVVVVGSWARGAARMDSDLDIVVLTDNPRHAEVGVWTGLLGGELIRLQDWGPLREVRVRRPSGFDVELGVVPLSWADTDPVDPGTRRVIRDGHRILHDPAGVLASLSAAC